MIKLLIEGGLESLESVQESIRNEIPVVIVKVKFSFQNWSKPSYLIDTHSNIYFTGFYNVAISCTHEWHAMVCF